MEGSSAMAEAAASLAQGIETDKNGRRGAGLDRPQPASASSPPF